MKLENFIEEYDTENSIILLEGKRKVNEIDKEKLIKLGILLANKTSKMRFRSGNAKGADYYFSYGVSSIDKNRLEIIIPYNTHRQKDLLTKNIISLEDFDLIFEEDLIQQSMTNKKMSKLITKYSLGERDKYSIKAAYIIRDTLKVIGNKLIKPTNFGIFYDDLSKPKTGGTGHTMDMCTQNHIPFIVQKTWFNWL